MTERTFRSPSPGRSPAPVHHDIPPVPSIPNVRSQQRPRSSHNPTTNIQTQPFLTASQKLKLKEDQQGSWFGAARPGDASNVRTSDSVLHHAATEVSEPRPGSISPSINFSYPRARHESPAPSTASASEVVMVYDANSRRMVPKVVEKVDLLERNHSVRSASEKPVKKKKQAASRSGSHLVQGNVNRTKTAPIETSQPVPPTSERTQTTSQPAPEAPEAPEAVAQVVKPSEQPIPRPQEETLSHTEPTPVTNEETKADTIVTDGPTAMPTGDLNGPVLHKKPSTVLEEPEIEESADATETTSTKPHAAIDAVPVHSTQVITAKTEPTPVVDEQTHRPAEPNPQHGSVRRTRVHSESPARSPGRAHFAPTADQLVVRHEPPPRSLSPRKSALKHSSSVRGASPSDDSSEASGPMSSFSKDDAAQARKKAARVSFNEDYNVVLGESAEPPENESPVLLSPQVKHKPWRNFMSRSKKDSSLDEDETMSPRPALPLFGSVREKKTKEPDNERPLVRPTERTWSPPPQESSSQGASTDSAIGTVLAQELSTKNEANISKTREPLPPVVQSIEGNGYISSSAESSDDEQEDADVTKPSQVKSTPSVMSEITAPSENAPDFVETQQADKVVVSSPQAETIHPPTQPAEPVNGSAISQAAVKTTPETNETTGQEERYLPSISVINATPPAKVQVEDSPDRDYFDVPGGFPEDAPKRQATKAEGETINTVVTTEPTEAAPKPDTSVPDSGPPPSPSRVDAGAGALPMADIAEEEESSDHSSIYSDAYEDLSDVGGDGFMSLNAVLEAPPKSQVSKLYEKTVTESKAQASADGAAVVTDAEPLKTPDDWENAKAYWKSLTVEKRRQLEKEAIEEAGEEADQEEAFSKPKKTKKRRSTDRPPSRHEPGEAAINPERVYQIQPGTTWTEDQAHSQSGSEPPSYVAPQDESFSKKFRKSMRAEQPPKVEATKQAGTGFRKSMRSNGTSGDAHASMSGRDVTTAPRPVSYHVGASVEPSRNVRRALSSDGRPMSASGPTSVGMKPSLRRRGSDSSESSFKRARSNTGEGFGFRRTMRAQSQEPDSPRAANGSGRFSIRSLSPTGSPFRRSGTVVAPAPSMGGGGRMRTSLRAAPADKEKSRFSTFGRSSGKKAKKGLGGSRFANSSDEDDGPQLFTSRFAESSDEEDVSAPAPKPQGFAKTMRATKGMSLPATLGRGPVRSDSPDLPDSDDDVLAANQTTANGQARPILNRNRSSGRGSLNGAPPGVLSTEGVAQRPTHRRRGSFMSSILGRKKDTAGKISRDTSESAARRDTNLERSTEQLAVIRSNSGGHPRLQKRGPNWPLADGEGPSSPVAAPEADQRPATSAGPGSPTAPRGFLKRRSLSAQQVPPVPPIPAVPKTQMSEVPPERSQMTEVPPDATLKKKKFGTIRKMFGLTD